MDFFEAIKARRSVRKYKKQPVPDEVINKALDAALIAPNSSNLQPWEFYWVRSEDKKSKLVEACLSQGAATTADQLIVFVSRIDTWKKHANQIIEHGKANERSPSSLIKYYTKLIPFFYRQDPFGILGCIRSVMFFTLGLFRPMMRGPRFKKDLFEVVSKTTALACENFMLAIAAQGYGSCPMEGFDERRVKKLLKLNSKSHVVMVISVGAVDPDGIWGEQFRVPRDQVVFTV